MAAQKTQYLLRGFTQSNSCRTFFFEGVSADRSKTRLTVQADLILAKRHGIPLQELPLLCHDLLSHRDETAPDSVSLTFTEENMKTHAHACTLAKQEAGLKRRSFKRPGSQLGAAWRGPQLNS